MVVELLLVIALVGYVGYRIGRRLERARLMVLIDAGMERDTPAWVEQQREAAPWQ